MPKIIHYRSKCIGCNICFELQPECWRMSMKDGKATLLKSAEKKDVYIRLLNENQIERSYQVAEACPVNITKIL